MFTSGGQTFETVAIARRVVVDGWERGTCTWMVEDHFRDQDGMPDSQIVDCGAEAAFGPDGFACAAGHAHVSAEARSRQGWDYAHDATEAGLLAKAGVEARDMAGRVFA